MALKSGGPCTLGPPLAENGGPGPPQDRCHCHHSFTYRSERFAYSTS